MSEPAAPPARAHRTGGGVARVPIVVGLVALLAAGGFADRQHRSSPSHPGGVIQPVSVAAAPAALSSSWFCAGVTGTAGGAGPGQLVIANAGPQARRAVVSVIPSAGVPPRPVTVTVAPRSRQVVPEVLATPAPWVGAIVDLDGGQASVEQQVTGSLGVTATPCATSGSNQWYFTSGQTLVNASMELNLLNPYPTDAIVDLSFTTDQGVEEPGDFQALAVPAGGMLAVDVGSHLRRRSHIATRVTARSGRVVAWKTDVVTPPAPGTPLLGAASGAPTGAPSGATGSDPADPVPGVTISVGSPAPATWWSWPDGVTGDGVDEQYVIFNPGPGTAQVQLALDLQQGSAEPFNLSIGPDAVTRVVSSAEARVPAGVAHSATLRSTNGVPVVASRLVTAGPPSAVSGRGELAGATAPARRWLLGAGGTSADLTMWAVLFNPAPVPATVTVESVGVSSLRPVSVTVPAGGRQAVHLNDQAANLDAAVEVTGSAPVVVERDVYGTHQGVSLSMGVPLRDG